LDHDRVQEAGQGPGKKDEGVGSCIRTGSTGTMRVSYSAGQRLQTSSVIETTKIIMPRNIRSFLVILIIIHARFSFFVVE
jgi:hypothetical protein